MFQTFFTFTLMELKPDDNRVIKFADYLVDTFIGEDAMFPPDMWTCASIDRCLTTNACESFHAHFNSSFNSTYSNIYAVIAKLKEIQIETYIKINSLDAPFKFHNTKTKKKINS